MVVSPGDPRNDLRDFVQIGEGSTGVVLTAHQVFWFHLLRNHMHTAPCRTFFYRDVIKVFKT